MWRSNALAQTFIARTGGTTIAGGPFEGIIYSATATEGALVARLLGVYKSGLHPHIEAFTSGGVDCVIDVGCAEGYYAVGLARRIPGATVYAHDVLESARTACAAMAAANGVADRVIVGGEFSRRTSSASPAAAPWLWSMPKAPKSTSSIRLGARRSRG